MKNLKSTQKESYISIINKAFVLFIMIATLTLITSSIYSKNHQNKNFEFTIKQPEAKCLDTVKKRKTITSNHQNNNERLIIKLNELDKLAEFPGGMENFYKKVSTNLDANELSYTGFTQIHVSFIIEKDGSMSQIVVDSTLDSELKKEIIDGLKSIKTKWSPATLNNNPIRMEYSLPIVLNLE